MDWFRVGGIAAMLGLLGGLAGFAFLKASHERATGHAIDLEAGSSILAGSGLAAVVAALAVISIAAAIHRVRNRS